MRPGLKPLRGALVGGANVGKRLNSLRSDSSRFLSHIGPSAQPSALTGAHGSTAGSGARAGVAGLAACHIASVVIGENSGTFPA
jgi:hypothetical protein